MNEETIKFNKSNLEIVANNLKKHFFNVEIFNTKQEVLEYLTKVIKKEDVIGYGGSKSLEEIGFFEEFTPTKYPNIVNRKQEGLTADQKRQLQCKALTGDVFLASPNGLSITGEMVFIDKNGNRNAAVTYGPKHVFLIAGINKIVPTFTDALNRASNVAAIKNNIRFGIENPCTKVGHCCSCQTHDTLCGITTILQKCFPENTKTVLLVNQELGF